MRSQGVSLFKKISLGVVAAFIVVVLINRILLSFSYETDLGGVEESLVYFLQRDLLNLKLYHFPEKPPFFLNQYAPIYFALTSGIMNLMSIGADEVRQIFVTGRLLQVFWNVLASIVIFLILRKGLRFELIPALLFGSLSFAVFFPHHYAMRPDSLKCLSIFASFYFLLQAIRTQKLPWLILSGLIITAATFTKQDALAFAALFPGFVFFVARSLTLRYLLSIALFTILFAAASMYAYGMEEVYYNLIAGNNQGFSLRYFVSILQSTYHFIFMYIVVGVLVYFAWGSLTTLERGIAGMSLTAFIIQLLSAMKWGAAPVYITESLMFLLITMGIIYRQNEVRRMVVISFVALLVFAVDYSLDTNDFNKRWYRPGVQNIFYLQHQEWSELKKYIEANRPSSLIYVQHKSVLPYFTERAIFPTYEDQYPFYRFCIRNNLANYRYRMGAPNRLFDFSEWPEMLRDKTNEVLVLYKTGCQLPPPFDRDIPYSTLIDEKYQLKSMTKPFQ